MERSEKTDKNNLKNEISFFAEELKLNCVVWKGFRLERLSIECMIDRFTDVWERRKKVQLNVTKYWIDKSWTKGRKQFLTFLVRIKNEELIEKIVEIQSRLSTLSCVAAFPKDYFHVSVAGLGFLVKSEEYEDDILIENLQRIINQAKEVLQPFSKFNVLLSRLNIFPDVVFVEVHDGGRIEEILRKLQAIPEIGKREFVYPSFLPHVSIMHFRKRKDFRKFISCLEKLRHVEFGKMTVNSIELVNAHLSREYPKLDTIHAFELK